MRVKTVKTALLYLLYLDTNKRIEAGAWLKW
jgi:hypothetical protein